MNLYKRRLLKSEEVKIVPPPRRGDEKVGEASDDDPPPLSGMPDPSSALDDAYRQGLEEGMIEGRKKAERELGDAFQLVREITDRVTRLHSEMLASVEKDIVTLAIAIAEKILHQELTTNREAVTAVFRSGLEAIEERDKMQVKCNPADLEVLQAYLPDLKASYGGLNQVEFIPDSTLSPGGVKIESALCEVDASLETRLTIMRNVLFS